MKKKSMSLQNGFPRVLEVVLLAMAFSLFAKEVGKDEILFAAKNWIGSNALFWGDAPVGEPVDAQRIVGEEPLPLWAVRLSPAGYIVLSADDTLPPVVAFSPRGDFSGIPDTFSLMLARQGEDFQKILSEEQRRGDDASVANQERWDALLSVTRVESINPSAIIRESMLDTEWAQYEPFNALCPTVGETTAHAVTGCVAVAIAQILKFHEWPVEGVGSRENDDDEGEIQAAIKADYSFPYNWGLIKDEYGSDLAASELIPLARLLMDAGTLGSADYEQEETAAYSSSLNELFSQHLRYSSSIEYGDTRNGFVGYTSRNTLYSRIRQDMVEGRPAILSFSGHAFVADGLGTSSGLDYYHFNYGWGGYKDGWYLLTDGYASTVVITATTNIMPKAEAAFRPISCEQPASFTLSWDFPKRIAAQAFRLTRVGTRAAPEVISDSIAGTARSYDLTGQSGTNTYALEAKVNGAWQPASEGVTITVKSSPAALPTLTMEEELTSIAGVQVTTTIASSTTLKSLTVTSSRPDMLPAGGISITGGGSSRTVRLTPADGVFGSLLLYVTATDNAGNVVKQVAMLNVLASKALVWHTSLNEAIAASDGKFVLMVAGRDTCGNTNYFRNIVCETPDIKANLVANYSLWYCNVDATDGFWKYVSGGGGYLPFIAIIDPKNLSSSLRYHGDFMSIAEGRSFLDIQTPCFSLDEDEIYPLGATKYLELSVLQRGVVIRYRTDDNPPTALDTLYSAPIALTDTTTITACAFKDGQPVSEAVTRRYVFLEQVAKPVLSKGTVDYFADRCVVTATCATEGATIRYTTDLYYPTESSPVFPAEGLTVTEDTIILVRAYKEGLLQSEWTVSELYLVSDLPDAEAITTSNGLSFHYYGTPWILQTTTYKSKPSAMKSGAISDGESTTMVAKVTGSGTLSFYWRVSSEPDYDLLSFRIDGQEMDVISGSTSWIKKTFTITGEGEHYYTWTYNKDRSYSANSDCAWVDDVVWVSDPIIRPLAVDGQTSLREAGESIEVTAEFREGFTFQGWTVDGVEVADATQATIAFVMPANAVTLTSNYTANLYPLTVDGVVELVAFGTEVERTAEEKEAQLFMGWTVNGVEVSDAMQATIAFVMPANAVTLNSCYRPITPFTYPLAAGWNFIVVTRAVNEATVQDILSRRPFVFDTETMDYTKADVHSIEEGAILMMYSHQSEELTINGISTDWKPAVMMPGWNLIGFKQDIEKGDWPVESDAVWEWTGQCYELKTDRMEAGKAYWIYIEQ